MITRSRLVITLTLITRSKSRVVFDSRQKFQVIHYDKRPSKRAPKKLLVKITLSFVYNQNSSTKISTKWAKCYARASYSIIPRGGISEKREKTYYTKKDNKIIKCQFQGCRKLTSMFPVHHHPHFFLTPKKKLFCLLFSVLLLNLPTPNYVQS